MGPVVFRGSNRHNVSSALEFQSEGEARVKIAERTDGGEKNPRSCCRLGLVGAWVHLMTVSGTGRVFRSRIGFIELAIVTGGTDVSK